MKITLWPDLVDWPLKVTVNGDTITINDEPIDLSGIPDGYQLPAEAVGNKFFVDGTYVERIGKTLHFKLRLPVSIDTEESVRNPDTPLVIDARNGAVKLPETTPTEPE